MASLHPRDIVVVGVDETLGSRAALAFAIREAGLRGSSLEVITAWSWAPAKISADRPTDQARRHAQQVQDDAIALTLSETDARPVLSRQVVRGDAGEVLRKAAIGAAYLVVGASREGRRRPVLFDSVSDYCLRHANCAVVIVRESSDPRRSPDLGHIVDWERPASANQLRGEDSSLGTPLKT